MLSELIGSEFAVRINCDRARMSYQHKVLQRCRDHLKHDFQALIDSTDTQLKRLGHDLMRDTKRLFAEYAMCHDRTTTHETFKRNLRPVRQRVESLLLRGFSTAAHGMCTNSVRIYWTFLKDPNVTSTNNSSERSLRHRVIWRELSFETRSERGDRFVENMLTVIETCP